jgi:AhpD family alkylhydroperoxidase
MSKIEEWKKERARLNELLLSKDHLGIKRFFRLDSATYETGALDAKTKEMLGLACSVVLRCDDCINYHLIQCAGAGVTTEELLDIINISLIVGGSITIPHIRRAMQSWEELHSGK